MTAEELTLYKAQALAEERISTLTMVEVLTLAGSAVERVWLETAHSNPQQVAEHYKQMVQRRMH